MGRKIWGEVAIGISHPSVALAQLIRHGVKTASARSTMPSTASGGPTAVRARRMQADLSPTPASSQRQRVSRPPVPADDEYPPRGARCALRSRAHAPQTCRLQDAIAPIRS